MILEKLLTQLAYRLDESSSPNSSSEKTKRVASINASRRKIWSEGIFWWSEFVDTSLTTISGQQEYDMPVKAKILLDVRVDGNIRKPMITSDAMNTYTENQTFTEPAYYLFADKIVFLPTPSTAGDQIKIKGFLTYPGDLEDDSDETVIPDDYVDLILSYAEWRHRLKHSMPGDASIAAQEYNDLLKGMKREDNKRGLWAKGGVSEYDPLDIRDYAITYS